MKYLRLNKRALVVKSLITSRKAFESDREALIVNLINIRYIR